MKMHPELTGAIPDSRGINLFAPTATRRHRCFGFICRRDLFAPPRAAFDAWARWPGVGSIRSPRSPITIRRRCRCAPHRRRLNADRQAPGLCRDGAPRVRRFRPGGDVAPRRRLGWPRADAAGSQVRADLSVRPGRVRALLPGQHDRLARPDARASAIRRWSRGSSTRLTIARLRHARAGRDVHDRAGRRLRHRATATRAGRSPDGSWRSPATSGSARTPMPTSRWCWRAARPRPA